MPKKGTPSSLYPVSATPLEDQHLANGKALALTETPVTLREYLKIVDELADRIEDRASKYAKLSSQILFGIFGGSVALLIALILSHFLGWTGSSIGVLYTLAVSIGMTVSMLIYRRTQIRMERQIQENQLLFEQVESQLKQIRAYLQDRINFAKNLERDGAPASIIDSTWRGIYELQGKCTAIEARWVEVMQMGPSLGLLSSSFTPNRIGTASVSLETREDPASNEVVSPKLSTSAQSEKNLPTAKAIADAPQKAASTENRLQGAIQSSRLSR